MKIFLKRSTAFFVAVLIFCFSVVPVSAAVSFPNIKNYHTNGTLLNRIYSDFFSNPSVSKYYSPSNDVFVYQKSSDGYYSLASLTLSRISSYTWTDSSTNITYDIFFSQSMVRKRFSVPPDDVISSYEFTSTINSQSSSKLDFYGYVIAYNRKDDFYFISEYNYNYYAVNKFSLKNIPDIEYSYLAYNYEPYLGPVLPDPTLKPTLYGIKLGIEKKGFVDWLKSEGKESVINSAGFSFASSQLETLVDVYDSYGNNPLAFFSSLSKTFNITTDLKAASSLIQTIQQLYHDYLTYKNSVEIEEIKPSSATHPHWRTDKEDDSLVTDQSDDTRDILILREILRTLIDMPYAVSVRFNYLQTGLTDILIDFQNLISVVDSLPDDLSNNISVGFDNSINTLVIPLTDINNSINSLVVPLTDINNSIRSLDFSSGGSGILTEDLERLLLIPEDSQVFDDYNLMLQQHFYYDDLDSLPDLEDFIRLEQPVSLSSMDDEPLPDIYDSDLYYSAPVVELSNVSFDIDNYKVDFDDSEKFAVIDFSDDRWKTPVKFIRGIIGCLVLLWFCNWVVRFFPSLLSGYSSED